MGAARSVCDRLLGTWEGEEGAPAKPPLEASTMSQAVFSDRRLPDGRRDDDGAERGEIATGHALDVRSGHRADRGDVALEVLVAHARFLERGQIPGLARIGAAVHGEAAEQIRLADPELLVGDRLSLDAL